MVALFRRFRRAEARPDAAVGMDSTNLPSPKPPSESLFGRLRRFFTRSEPVDPAKVRENNLIAQISNLKLEYANLLKDPIPTKYDVFLDHVQQYNENLKEVNQPFGPKSPIPHMHNQLVKQLKADENYTRAKARDSVAVIQPKPQQEVAPDPLAPPPPLQPPPPLRSDTTPSATITSPTPKPVVERAVSQQYGDIPVVNAQNDQTKPRVYDREPDLPVAKSAYGILPDDDAVVRAAIDERKRAEPTNYASMPESLSVANAHENKLGQVQPRVSATNGTSSHYGMPARQESAPNPKAIYVDAPKLNQTGAAPVDQYGDLPSSPDIKLHHGQLSLPESKHDRYIRDLKSTPNNAADNLKTLYDIQQATTNKVTPESLLERKDIHQLASLHRELRQMSHTMQGASEVANVVNARLAAATAEQFGDKPTFTANQFTSKEYEAMRTAVSATRTEDTQLSKNLYVMQKHQEAVEMGARHDNNNPSQNNLYQVIKVRDFTERALDQDKAMAETVPGWDQVVSTVQSSSGQPMSVESLQQDNDAQLVEAALKVSDSSSRQVYGEGFLLKVSEELGKVAAKSDNVEVRWAKIVVQDKLSEMQGTVYGKLKSDDVVQEQARVLPSSPDAIDPRAAPSKQPTNYGNLNKALEAATHKAAKAAPKYETVPAGEQKESAVSEQKVQAESYMPRRPVCEDVVTVESQQTINAAMANQNINRSSVAELPSKSELVATKQLGS